MLVQICRHCHGQHCFPDLSMFDISKSTNVITRKVNTGNYSNQNNWSPVPTLNYEINDRVRWPVLTFHRSIAPSFIANLAYRQNSRLSRFPPLKIPRYTAKLSFRHRFSDSRHLDKIKALLSCVISNESFKNNTSDKVSTIERERLSISIICVLTKVSSPVEVL
jgi:hypothetical protein